MSKLHLRYCENITDRRVCVLLGFQHLVVLVDARNQPICSVDLQEVLDGYEVDVILHCRHVARCKGLRCQQKNEDGLGVVSYSSKKDHFLVVLGPNKPLVHGYNHS